MKLNIKTVFECTETLGRVLSGTIQTGWAFRSLATGATRLELYGDVADNNCEPEGHVFHLINQGDSALLNTIDTVQKNCSKKRSVSGIVFA